MKDLRYALTALLFLTLAAGAVHVHAAAPAAKIIYAFGQVQASSAAGKARRLRKGDQVFPGETVATVRGRAQMKFTDGGFASLQPNTQYRIDDYNFSGTADGKERSWLSLIKGSVRLVTGVIGRSNRSSFRIKTKVATIGIRGTMGKISQCDTNCGNLPQGTSIQGYGGVWDLVSGSFSGPVAAGDAYVCDGTTCRQIEGGVAQREDVGWLPGLAGIGPPYTQGNQVDDDGNLCDLGGNCGGTVVLLDQIGAEAFQGSPGDTEADDDIAVVLVGGFPIARIFVDDDLETSEIGILTIDFDALQAALSTFPDPDVAALGQQILDSVDESTLAEFRSMPASVAPEDFGLTSDGILTKGRWVDGYVLDVEAFLDAAGMVSETFTELIKLTGYQSEHFIYGQDPGAVPLGGDATYNFTGGTYSTATDGSSYGMGVTSGQLMWTFGLGTGSLNMTVDHDSMIFAVFGSLRGDGTRTFLEDSVSASSGRSSYPVTLDGFFAGPPQGSSSPPLAAGLAYAIDMFSSKGYDIIGTAGFGLVPGSSPPPSTPPSSPGPLPLGAYVAASHAFNDGFSTNGNAWDFLIDGAGNVATLTGDSVDSFSAAIPADPGDAALCTPACTFDSSAAIIEESGSMASIGVSWVRWSVGHSFTHAFIASELGDAHIIKNEAPITTLPTGVIGTYTLGTGGGTGATTPSWNFGPGGASLEEATSSTNTLTVNFTDGTQTASHNIVFPSGTVSLFGTISTPVATTNTIFYNGNVAGAVGSCTGCVFGKDHFTFAGSGAGFVVGAGQFNTSGLGGTGAPQAAGAFTFKLPGSFAAFP